ncbi:MULTISPECIES: hypothetical protein [unclassified Mesorhizobium]|uniref:hypothetical protein n=1 Tax=unclassified Mesorhizobium TaxID=325217 RepID=UPI000FCCB13B|nr:MULTISPECIES: hypothetical protein [unclassified Mesorhizobium]RUV41403.1 hypothetical protein EOD29_22880 [Mesorhizobium sp. M1A.T.Ca.IN.004.03.1.1]RWK36631.1 MAG: hypothetical protein EOR40_13395 [Mesorhizobium sp.]TIP18771.1 MAG: hypothetical protein E5X66_13485 [Mesorhizobium sp.]TJV83586.1 MAG: hypothetical protein E5X45_10690 [Mesorhizobium sp.]TJW16231.1 MAG: hypothetical protein E5X42_18585 [Mesorhizobium sp.]
MNFMTLTVTGRQLGDVLDLTDRRVRQLVEEGVFRRDGRNQYPLRDSVLAYLSAAAKDDDDELRTEKIALIRAQRRRIELENAAKEGTAGEIAYQDAVIAVVCSWWHLHIRPLATWLQDDLRARNVADSNVIAGTVQGWLISLRHEGEELLLAAADKARRSGIIITTDNDLAALLSRSSTGEDEAAAESAPSRRSKKGKSK